MAKVGNAALITNSLNLSFNRLAMKFKIDKNLKRLAVEMSADPVVVADKLCKHFIAAGIFADNEGNYGCPVLEAAGPQYVKDICALLAGFLYNDASRSIPSDVFVAFCDLIVMGEGDCPECGGSLKFVETEGHELKDGDRDTPNSYIIDKYVYKCRVCGEIIKSEVEL